jgi:hypothetical protein
MAGIYDLPNMGNDFTSLANSARPNYNVPMEGAGAGWMLGSDLRRQDQFLDRATQEAEMNARLRAQQAEEYGLGAPGRRDTIELNNRTAAAGLADLPETLEAARSKRRAQMTKDQQEEFKALQAKINEYADLWNAAKDDEEKQEVIDQMDAAGIKKMGNRTTKEIPIPMMDKLMAMARRANVESAGHEQKKQIEDIKTKRALEVAETNRQRALEVEKYRAEALVAVAQLVKQGKEAAMKGYEALLKKKIEGTITPYEEAIFEALRADIMAGKIATEANKPQQFDLDSAVKGGTPQVRQPTVPSPAQMPATPQGAPAAKPGARVMPKAQALEVLKGMKGTAQEAAARKFYKETYGEDPQI